MPLGQGIGELWEAVRDRVEVSGEAPTWHVTAGSFDSALSYAREAFGEPVVLARTDRDRWWPRVTITVTTDPVLAASAPPLENLAHPPVPPQPTPRTPEIFEISREPEAGAWVAESALPSSLEAIFAHQEELRIARQRRPEHDSRTSA